MKKNLCSFLIVGLAVFFSASRTSAAIFVPSGLNVGDTYHLIFVSSTTRNATSPNVSDYDAHVQAAADAAGIGTGSAIGDLTWSAIVSTPTISAADHINVTGSVYSLDDTFIAAGESDLFDFSLAAAVNLTELMQSATDIAWTGTNGDGTSAGSGVLGSLTQDLSIVGEIGMTNGRWLRAFFRNQAESHAIYGISQELTVGPNPTIPEPVSATVWFVLAILAVRVRRS